MPVLLRKLRYVMPRKIAPTGDCRDEQGPALFAELLAYNIYEIGEKSRKIV